MKSTFSTHGGGDAHDAALRVVREGRERVDREHRAINDVVSSRAFEPYAEHYSQAAAAGTLLESALRAADAALLVGRPAGAAWPAAAAWPASAAYSAGRRCLEEFDGIRAGAEDIGACEALGTTTQRTTTDNGGTNEGAKDSPAAPASSEGMFGIGTRPVCATGFR
jgi:hypothetical protein